MDTIKGVALIGTFIGVLTIFAGAQIGFTQAGIDWKLYGTASIEGDSACFYDAKGVVQEPEQHVRVWTKCLPLNAAGADSEKDIEDTIAENAAQKIEGGYVPPIIVTGDMNFSQISEIVASEEIANIGHVEPQARIFYELNCSERMLRELSTQVLLKGASHSSNTPGDWKYVAPETNAARLLKFLCPN
jgi:hypothetical protein